MGRRLKASTVIFLATITGAMAQANYTIPVSDPDCPSYGKGTTWREYFVRARPANNAGVEFQFASDVHDRSTLVNIDPSACYLVGYEPGRGWFTSRSYGYDNPKRYRGTNDAIRMAQWDHRGNQLGDPRRGELPISGTTFYFDSAGYIFDSRGQKVGLLVCHGGNDCTKFGYKP